MKMDAAQLKSVVILGATGSVGGSTLVLLDDYDDRYHIYGLTGNSNVSKMLQLAERYKPELIAMANEESAMALQQALAEKSLSITVLSGVTGLCDIARASDVDIVVAAIVGVAGLAPTLAAVTAGKRVLLANKEALICAGDLFTQAVAKYKAELLPVDSEHCGIFQCIHGDLNAKGIKRLILTASGGPLHELDGDAFSKVTPEQACKHPIWSMGPKISVDSATLMNKGLELIEAAYLFGQDASKVETLIHPQSVVHALVEFNDGNMLAQLSKPDMRISIAVGLAWPERMISGVESLDLTSVANLEFKEPDYVRFPCLNLAREALKSGSDAPASLNAANEVAVDSFLRHKINFTDIPVVVEAGLATAEGVNINNLEDLAMVDSRARAIAQETINNL